MEYIPCIVPLQPARAFLDVDEVRVILDVNHSHYLQDSAYLDTLDM